MANFEAQIEGILGDVLGASSVPTRDKISQFLKDGVIDITRRCIKMNPNEIHKFARASAEQTSNASIDLNGAEIISVVRENGNNDQWRPCRRISPSEQYIVTDVESLNYASKINPAYMIGDNGEVNVFPAPASGGADSFKVYYVNNDPVNADGDALVYTHDNIKYFADDKVYLVVLYATIKTVAARMAAESVDTKFDALTISTVAPAVPAAPSLSYNNASIQNSVSTFTKSLTGVVPMYTKPTINADFKDFNDSDLYSNINFTLSAVAPVSPESPSLSYSDASIQNAFTTGLASLIASPPVYTVPPVGGTATDVSEATKLSTENTIDVWNDQHEVDQWFATVGHMLEGLQDVELANAQIAKINSYVNSYNSAMQNELHQFNDANTEYQAQLQKGLAEFNQDIANKIQKMQLSTNVELQNKAKALDADINEYNQKMALYQAQIQEYQAKVAAEVQEHTTQLNLAMQAWQNRQNNVLQSYQLDVQNELNEFNSENTSYQAAIQRDLAELNGNIQAQISLMNKSTDVDIQNRAKILDKEINEYNQKVARYQAELQEYQASVSKEVQQYTSSAQTGMQKYEMYKQLYDKLSMEYETAFLPVPQPGQQEQGEQRYARR